MIINNQLVNKNKTIKKIQKMDNKLNKDRKVKSLTPVKKNIGKLVNLEEKGINVPNDEGTLVDAITENSLIEAVSKVNLLGNSGNGYPVAQKLEAFSKSVKEAIIINGAECEPGLVHDIFLMTNKKEEIIQGALLLSKVFNSKKILIATRGKKEYFSNSLVSIGYVRLPYLYPLGEEHMLVKQVLNQDIAFNEHPVDKGVLVINVQTVYQILRIVKGIYDYGHFATVANMFTGKAYACYINNSTNINNLLSSLFANPQGIIYAGGGNNTACKISDNKCFDELTFFAAYGPESLVSNINKCRHCGGCNSKCPMGIKVSKIVKAKEADINADISEFGVDQCLHCGTCTYYCAAGKNPLEYVLNK